MVLWHLLGISQGCCQTSYSAQSPTAQSDLVQRGRATVEEHWHGEECDLDLVTSVTQEFVEDISETAT